MHFKTAIIHEFERVSQLADGAGELVNQNLADVLKAAAGKLKQASEHADCEAVDKMIADRLAAHEVKDKPPEQPPAFDPSKTQGGPDPKPDPGKTQ